MCTHSSLKPLLCQRDGCDALVHHLCQGAWERLKGYEDTVARLCCAHHPDYKHVGALSKVSVAVANAQNVMSEAKVVNVESQMTTDSHDFAKEDSEESSKADGSDDRRDSPISGGGKGGGASMTMSALYSPRSKSLITLRIRTISTSVPLTSWSVVRSLRRIASLWRRFTW